MLTPVIPLYLQPATHPQARACSACELRSRALFGVLDADGLQRIHADIATPSLAEGERLYGGGEAGAAVYTVRSGIVRFERVTAGGHRRIVRLAGRGDLIGQEALLQWPYADEAIACTPLQLCRIPRHLIDALGDAEPQMLRELMQRWQRALEASESWVAELTAGAARRRLLKLLQALDSLGGDDEGLIWLPRREDIGAMLDMTIETASRIVSALRREGVLELLPPRAARVDREALQAALQRQDAG
ncbi:MAG: Crp/Fnr family transcriptional regulator [Rubrivivax sp.]|nr:Crp/Fnr family transcriptional regulator [Rubrivivax sp.]MBK8527553.1 Crp/Fnr family transcriptional regulator [Rubrivivax sp.]